MKILLVLACLLAAGSQAWAQDAGKIGVGAVLGSPTGITGKLWLDGSHAIDAGIGFDSDVLVYGDYLWHSYNVFPQPAQGKMPVYLGLGAQVGDSSNNNLGLRAVAGIAYWLPRNPVEIFFDLVPVLHLGHNNGADLNASIGLRYYFN